jgi:polyribonucleotide nucleotidyltransferase
MFRDYCGWCKKGKAPKTMQTAFNDSKEKEPEKVFTLEVTKMTDEEFTKATTKTPKEKKENHVKLLEKLAADLKDHPEHAEEVRKALKEMTK